MTAIIDKSEEQKNAGTNVNDFKDKPGQFVVAAETTRMPIIFTDATTATNPIIFANNSFLTLSGYARDEILGQAFNFLLAHNTGTEDLSSIAAAFDSGSVDSEARFRRKNESGFWATVFISPVRDAAGNVIEHFVSLVDTTKHKDEQEKCKRLIDELNHRVKNTLSTVQSIIFQTVRSQSDPQTIRDSIESRIFSLSRSHDVLSAMHWRGAWLHDVVDAALEPFRGTGGHYERFVLTGSSKIGLTARASLTFGVVFHELANNAAKYGALSNVLGSVEIKWAICPSSKGPRLNIQWKEKNGPIVLEPKHRGFGTQAIERGLAHELSGEAHLDYRADGVICRINVPAPLEVLNE